MCDKQTNKSQQHKLLHGGKTQQIHFFKTGREPVGVHYYKINDSFQQIPLRFKCLWFLFPLAVGHFEVIPDSRGSRAQSSLNPQPGKMEGTMTHQRNMEENPIWTDKQMSACEMIYAYRTMTNQSK